MGANYKVGDLGVTISGVSDNAVDSLDEVITKLDSLQKKLGIVGEGFSGAFKVNNAAIGAVVGGLGDIVQTTRNATDSQEEFNKKIEKEQTTAQQALAGTTNAIESLLTAEQKKILKDYEQEQSAKKQKTAYLQLMLTTEKLGKTTFAYARDLQKLKKELNAADKAANKTAKGGLSKLLKQISRIALYRTIRRGLQLITQSFTQAIQEFAKIDGNINRTMSQLTSSTQVIKLSFGTILLPIIQAITPAVQSLSVGFANMANAINKSMALMNNNATYTKVNTDALKDYRKELNKTSGALFDFDKFRVLSSKQDTASIFLSAEEVSALDDTESKYTSIYNLVSKIGNFVSSFLETIKEIGEELSSIANFVLNIAVGALDLLTNSKLLKPLIYEILIYLTAMQALKFIDWIRTGAAKSAILGLVGSLNTMKGAMTSLGIAVMAVTAAVMILSNWGDFSSNAKKVVTAISGIIFALGTTLTLILAIKGAFKGPAGILTAIGLGVASLAAGVVMVRGLLDKEVYKYAGGASDIDGGAVFIAGEAGKTEMVYSGENGKTNVANVQQMYQAEYLAVLQALKDYGAARGEMPQLQPASDSGIYQAASRGARKVGKTFGNV